MDAFEIAKNNSKTQFTVIVSFIKLDIIIESKNRKNYIRKNSREEKFTVFLGNKLCDVGRRHTV